MGINTIKGLKARRMAEQIVRQVRILFQVHLQVFFRLLTSVYPQLGQCLRPT